MKLIFDTEHTIAEQFTIGGKARNLFRLKHKHFPVPRFLVIPQETMIETLKLKAGKELSRGEIESKIKEIKLDPAVLDNIRTYFPSETLFAVRSSAIDEDGSEFSFAGQFESYLFVPAHQLEAKIKEVWLSSCSERVLEYRKHHGLNSQTGIAVVVQQMIDADTAGVAFSINPISGNRREKLISSVYGLGEGLVSGELDADNFIVSGTGYQSEIAKKTHRFVLDKENFGTKQLEVESYLQEKPSLGKNQVEALGHLLDNCALYFGKPQDIEFAFYKGELFILQARPITNLHKIPDISADYILWDNSNIIESYPGVTTPLTFSFISKSYEDAYRLFCAYMGVEEKVIRENQRVFQNTLGLINGRVYYNLKTWYHMLAMLPGYSINARFMENMMGVKERFDIPESYRLSKTKAWWSIVKMAVSMLINLGALPKKRRKFKLLLDRMIAEYKAVDMGRKNSNELMELYIRFERELISEWKAPLLNDFFAMIYFGRLQKTCQKYQVSDNPNIHNDLLCGSADIISTQPIHRSIRLATHISANPELKQLFLQKSAEETWEKLQTTYAFETIYKEIQAYIHDFGERCIGELKLETRSYNQEPAQFIRMLQSYVETGINQSITSGKVEEEIRRKAEAEVNSKLKNSFFKKWKLRRLTNKTRILVSSRENLRYERTRAFGIVREIFSHIGENFYAEGIIENDRDIFYLTKEEIFAYIEGRSVSQDLKQLIALRKAEFAAYEEQLPPSERFASYGPVYHGNDFYSTTKLEALSGDLKGIGCCPGRVKAQVQVVLNPKEITSLKGRILVTSSTDPGWVTLFPSASAIIVERGSLLSHSAIVSREMGIPCIVGVTGLLRTLKTGDWVEMDGSTGEIKILEQENTAEA
ncbi:MAG: phosphoenolpyruvate synthase [Crocinitomicaceae bacterium]|jgi:pyruvate,water dikinase|nr:phosphoenolpyruvate synthase [Crocinitomicaceae bacterium]